MASILVIDDHEAVLETVKVILARQGHAIRTAPNGKAGMALMARRPFDLIITDIFMPEQDGIETIAQLRAISERLPILAISGCDIVGGANFPQAAKQIGASDTLAKPFRATELIGKVETLLGRAESRRHGGAMASGASSHAALGCSAA